MAAKRLKYLSLGASAALVAGLAACSEGDPGQEEPGEGGGEIQTVGLMVQDLSNPFFGAMEDALVAAAEPQGIEVNVQDGQQDLNTQNNQIDTFIQQQVDAILINAVDSEGIGPAVQRATDAGIIVVAVDVAAEGAQATVTLDNTAAGEEACTFLFEEMGGSGDILVVDGTPITSVQDRMSGCETVMEEYPDINVVGHQNGDNGRQEALSLTQDMLTANSDIDGIFAINDPSALGATLAAEQAGYTDLVIVGVDGSPEAVEALEDADSMFTGTAKQDPGAQVERGLEMAQQIAAGEELEEDYVEIPTEMLTRDNLADYEGW
ncbi:MAG TPA: ABC transporter substrate-binding protein [Candidatus Ruania gallistercoris]|uniref:ABC transporter substrate-binding protein n=1 Tax=Candidatus Ruania gallistercoris TaxID=2838746 RepID=A0A9D2EFL4_9MICO|nr:ABC transporter substrate-binding protein [Candidatus Ruania gallistercoris]